MLSKLGKTDIFNELKSMLYLLNRECKDTSFDSNLAKLTFLFKFILASCLYINSIIVKFLSFTVAKLKKISNLKKNKKKLSCSTFQLNVQLMHWKLTCAMRPLIFLNTRFW